MPYGVVSGELSGKLSVGASVLSGVLLPGTVALGVLVVFVMHPERDARRANTATNNIVLIFNIFLLLSVDYAYINAYIVCRIFINIFCIILVLPNMVIYVKIKKNYQDICYAEYFYRTCAHSV